MAEIRWRKTAGPVEIVKLSVGPMDNNVYLLASGDEAVLVDGSNEADAILAELGGRRLARILQTHGHGDHVVALPDLVAATNAEVFAHEGDAARMPVRVKPLRERDVVTVGSSKLDVVETPGHTAGGVCFVLREGGETHLFAGDTLFPGGPGNTFGDASAFATIMRSLDEKLFVLPDDTHVYPGHGADTTIGAERPSVPEWRARGW
jgi:glyoxylase-like metal-dependent hydrolase (beta-lactamase superfamily II)